MQLSVVQPIAPKWSHIRNEALLAWNRIVLECKSPEQVRYRGGILTKPGDNTKLSKSSPLPIWGLTLAPAGQSGYQLCPWRSKECEAACLGMTAGRSRFSNVQQARINKTRYLMEDPYGFWCEVLWDLTGPARRGGHFAFRGNVLSDIPYEALIPELLTIPKVCYDYTKSVHRAMASLSWQHNYKLTLSYTGHNAEDCVNFLHKGGNVAVVVNVPKKQAMPDEITIGGHKFPLINGDINDARWTDPCGVVVGLKPKGRIDTASPFVCSSF